MPSLENLKSGHGGARAGAGRKKGGRNQATVERLAALRLFRQRVAENAEALFDAQLKIAIAGDNKAIDSLLDRAFGKPTQAIEMSGPDGEPLNAGADLSALSKEDLLALRAIHNRITASRDDRDGARGALPN